MKHYFASALIVVAVSSCAPAVHGPDKQAAGGLTGAALGAGAGAVTGAQVSSATGPGVVVGAGFGAVAGGVQGYFQDQEEENLLEVSAGLNAERIRAHAQGIISEHYERRLQLHPTRDIFPADLFFDGDSTHLCRQGKAILRELAQLNRYRKPYSRLVVAVYSKSVDEDSTYANHLSERRSREVVEHLTRYGLEPRRLQTRSVVIDAPVLIDPEDRPDRYNQALEIIPLDR